MRKSSLVNAAEILQALRDDNNGVLPTEVNRRDVEKMVESGRCKSASWLFKPEYRLPERGMYAISPAIVEAVESGDVSVIPTATVAAPTASQHYAEKDQAAMTGQVVPMKRPAAELQSSSAGFTDNLIPSRDPLFVAFGNFSAVKTVIKSKRFFPVFITGMSGNGKTYMVKQACAQTKREVIRVNFTKETDEDDLIGGFRLINGETVYFKGPVLRAMEIGAVLLLDEIDLGDPAKIMCLQSILEGSGYFVKKTGEFVEPQPGFTVVATANTKGKGSDDGRFIGTNVLNEAFLERFPITCEQEYPSVAIEKKIMARLFESLEIEDISFSEKLVDWADVVRKAFAEEAVDEIISTRRLVHISNAFQIFNDKMKAIEYCLNRFDTETKEAFLELYTKVDEDARAAEQAEESEAESADSSDFPF